jgi:hypothetical protein
MINLNLFLINFVFQNTKNENNSTIILHYYYNTTVQIMTEVQKKAEKIFINNAEEALQIMTQEALQLKIKGVGLVCFIPGNETQSWVSKMIVVGSTGTESHNFIAIAYSKASEMAQTLQNSGSKVRPVKVGEFDYMGGAIKKIESGYILTTFSGASGEDDLAVSQRGLEWFCTKF